MKVIECPHCHKLNPVARQDEWVDYWYCGDCNKDYHRKCRDATKKEMEVLE